MSDFKISLSQATRWMNAESLQDNSMDDCFFTSVKIDSRTVTDKSLFFALPGERVDGHDFLKEAFQKGAIAAVINKQNEAKIRAEISSQELSQRILVVPDTVSALGLLAKRYRQQFKIPIAALTGSCGKTTVKEMVVNILSQGGPVLAPQGNLNTEIGVPLTLLRLEPKHKAAVIEMGARKKGDIRYLMSLVEPDVTLITNAGIAHVEIFGSEQGIAIAKGEIFAELKPSGTAIINADDKSADYWKSLLTTQQCLTFGLNNPADIMAKPLESAATATATATAPAAVTAPAKATATAKTSEKNKNNNNTGDRQESGNAFELMTPKGSVPIQLKAPGQHNIYNALSAASIALALGRSLEDIQTGLQQFLPVSGRLQIKTGLHGSRILDDTYNANPVSVKAALKVLASYPGEKIFVMGDMLELGENSLELHKQIGIEAQHLGIEVLLGLGKLTQATVEGFSEKTENSNKRENDENSSNKTTTTTAKVATHFSDKLSLIQSLQARLHQEVTVLVKGSRSMRMEEVVRAIELLARENQTC